MDSSYTKYFRSWTQAFCGSGIAAAGLLVVVFLFTSVDVAAQQSEAPAVKATIGVRVMVGQGLSVVGTNDLNFGQVAVTGSGGQKVVDKSSPDAGRFELFGSLDQDVRVSYNAPRTLTRSTGTGSIGVSLSLYGAPTLDNAGSAERLLQNDVFQLADGRYFFFVGGELNVGPLDDNPPGRYLGEFELELSHVDL